MEYIWQKKSWPSFFWDSDKILPSLAYARKRQGGIQARSDFFELKEQSELILDEAFTTSEIEGETLDRSAVRSSIARRLGLPTAGLPDADRRSDGLVEMLMDATGNFHKPLTLHRLWGWQAGLFPTGYSGIAKLKTGGFRTGEQPMRILSGSMGKEKIHFEAPPAGSVEKEIDIFLDWWSSPPAGLDGLIRAGIAHFWFVTIHPFEDGNGRVARALTDMAIAQDENSRKRLYSLSSAIVQDRKKYYALLESEQKGDGDLTDWLDWFFRTFSASIDYSTGMIEKALFLQKFYRETEEIELNVRQRKVLKKLLDIYPEDFTGGLTNRKYTVITKTSTETAKRDLKDLVTKGILHYGDAGGRSTYYLLNRRIINENN